MPDERDPHITGGAGRCDRNRSLGRVDAEEARGRIGVPSREREQIVAVAAAQVDHGPALRQVDEGQQPIPMRAEVVMRVRVHEQRFAAQR